MDLSTVGSYHLNQVIGRGSMGVVYHAVRATDGATVAIKTLPETSIESLSAIRREIRVLAALRHPGIVRILDDGVESGIPWYAMELLQGTSLREILDAPQPNAGELLAALACVCDALSYLHGEGVVHRDLKPENILIATSGPVLVDFGLASPFAGGWNRERFSDGEFSVGTLAYIPPEQILGEFVDARADLYSLGCILFEALAGQPPFNGTPDEILSAHLIRQPELPATIEISGDVRELVLRLLSKEPHDRPGHASYVAKLLRKHCSGSASGSLPSKAYLYRPRLKGREDLIDEWDALLENLEEGKGGIVVLTGESGSGKTRLMLELSHRAYHRKGLRILGAKCAEPFVSIGGQKESVPFSFVLRRPLETLADVLLHEDDKFKRKLGPERCRILSNLVSNFANLFPEDCAPRLELAPDRFRSRFRECLLDLFILASQIQPILFLIDDLQWADSLTLDFLSHLAAGNTRLPFSIVASCRTEETGEPIAEILRQPRVVQRWIDGLSEPSIREMICDMLATESPPEDFTRYVLGEAEGNPFYVAEYLRVAVDQRVIYQDSDCVWQFRMPSTGEFYLPVPESLQLLVQQHIRLLSSDSRHLLQLAAVIGKQVREDVLRLATSLPEEQMLAALSELILRSLLIQEKPDALGFHHDKLREVCYEMIPPDDRPAYHHAVASALEHVAGTQPEYYSLMATHFLQTTDRTGAARYALLAARDASSRHSQDEAAWFYRQYLRTSAQPSVESVSVRIEFAISILANSGKLQQARQELRVALDEAQHLEDPLSIQLAGLQLGRVCRLSGDVSQARKFIDSALHFFSEHGPRNQEANAHVALASIQWDQSELEPAEFHFDLAMRIFEELGDAAALGVTLNSLAQVYFLKGEYDRAIPILMRALDLLKNTGDVRNLGATLNTLASVCWIRGQLDRAAEIYEEALGVHKQAGDLRAQAAISSNLGMVRAEAGQPNEALALLESARLVFDEIGDPLSLAYVLNTKATVLRQAFGDYSAAMRALDESEQLLRKVNNLQGLGLTYCERGHLALALGQSADSCIEKSRKILTEIHSGTESELGKRVRLLEASQTGASHGRPLIHGQLMETMPPLLQKWLEDSPQSHKEHKGFSPA